IVSTSAIVMALSGEGWFCRMLRWAPLRFIGVISYSMYLIHVTVLEVTLRYVSSTAAVFAIGLAVTIAYSAATWYGFERRMLQHGGAGRDRVRRQRDSGHDRRGRRLRQSPVAPAARHERRPRRVARQLDRARARRSVAARPADRRRDRRLSPPHRL